MTRTKSAIKGSSATKTTMGTRVSRAGRTSTLQTSDERLGKSFGGKAKGFTIGVKREGRTE